MDSANNTTSSTITRHHLLMTSIVLTIGLVNLFFGEILPAGKGLGWDGLEYARMTRELVPMIEHGELSNYYAKRLLPSVIVSGMLRIAQSDFSSENIVFGFKLLNLIAIFICTLIWKRIADLFDLSMKARWLGFGGFFMIFLTAKLTLYSSVHTDVCALLINLLMFKYHIERRPFALFITTLAGSFVWQITGIYGVFLLGLMNLQDPEKDLPGASQTRTKEFIGPSAPIFKVIAWALAASLLAYAACDWLLPKLAVKPTRIDRTLRFFTGLPSTVSAIIGLLILAGSQDCIRSNCARLRLVGKGHAVLATLGVMIPWMIVRQIANPALANASGFSRVLGFILYPPDGTGKFLLPLVALTLLWGPSFLMMVLCWKRVCREIRRLGPGAVAVVGFTIPLGLATEPRFILGAWPIAMVALVLAVEKMKTSHAFLICFTVLTVAYAKFWLKMNIAPWGDDDLAGLLEFPKQMLFMHYGPWMSWTMYLVQLPLVLLSGAWLKRSMSRRDPELRVAESRLPSRLEAAKT